MTNGFKLQPRNCAGQYSSGGLRKIEAHQNSDVRMHTSSVSSTHQKSNKDISSKKASRPNLHSAKISAFEAKDAIGEGIC